MSTAQIEAVIATKARNTEARWRQLVRDCRDSIAIDPDEAVEILEAAGKTHADLADEVAVLNLREEGADLAEQANELRALAQSLNEKYREAGRELAAFDADYIRKRAVFESRVQAIAAGSLMIPGYVESLARRGNSLRCCDVEVLRAQRSPVAAKSATEFRSPGFPACPSVEQMRAGLKNALEAAGMEWPPELTEVAEPQS